MPRIPNPPEKKTQDNEEYNPITSLDPTTPLTPRPLIADILRTRYCVPGSVFLIESVERRVLVPDFGLAGTRRRRPKRAVRLLLGDGALCIQAFVRGESHWLVDGGSVFEGGYVLVEGVVGVGGVLVGGEGEEGGAEERGVEDDDDGVGVGDTEGLELELERGWEGVGGKGKGKGKEKRDERVVVYLIVGDMVTVGWNNEYLAILKREAVGKEGGGVGRGVGEENVDNRTRKEREAREDGDDFDDQDEDELIRQLLDEELRTTAAMAEQQPTKPPPIDNPSPPPKQAPEKNTNELDHTSDSDSAFETLTISAERATARRITTATPDHPRQELQAATIKQKQPEQHHHHHHHHQNPPIAKPRPWLPTDATQPLKLTPLSQIPHLPYRQNWMINVLAILTSLSPVEPSHIGPSFKQRTARLTDMSTHPRQVHLTVYLDPEEFSPGVGGVVLLMGVKNHLFEGGSLRKYVSDGLGGGKSWWVEKVEGLGWCEGEVGRLRAWWGSVVREGVGGAG